jgi:CRISPR-associated protein Csx17
MTGATSHDVVLTGCRPEPLGSYLKALGVFRIVAEQRDPEARGSWRGEHFVVRSTLDRDALLQFLLERWQPTPVIAPWNGGSGFYPKDNREAPDAICASGNPRLAPFIASIEIARAFVANHGSTERPEGEAKLAAISAMRAQLPDEALAWLDAAVVLGNGRLLFPPLLGTGGNDGRLDFSNNFQQRVVEVVTSPSSLALQAALFGTATTSRYKGAMGQYQPASSERTNPWDFVLLIEGAMMFAAAATRRYETAGRAALSFPFHARAAGGLATVVDTDEAESRDELWVPLWSAPATFRAVQRLFAEGRATVGTGDQARSAATGLDFARAVTALGVDRGIDAFSRVGFHVRNGLSYYATPLGRFATGDVRAARLLDDVDQWFDLFRYKTASKTTPARVALARRRLEQAMFDAVATGSVGPVVLELGDAERALAQSLAFSKTEFLEPVPRLSSSWAAEVVDGSVEQRLAAALAARLAMRRRLVPLDQSGRYFGELDTGFTVFRERPLVDNLHALLIREDLDDRLVPELSGPPRCTLSDIAAFIADETDDSLIERWLRALVLIDGGLAVAPRDTPRDFRPPATFAVLSIVHGRRLTVMRSPRPEQWRNDLELPRTAGVLARACAGDAVGATSAALRRLSASARPIPVPAIYEPPVRMRRIAAALACSLIPNQRRALERMVLSPRDLDNESDASQEQA